jgi:geranylgeranyl diphosphate synthase type I
MEFLQACALVHDDVMDNSDSRRGRPAMHRQFRDLHETAEWAGDPANFGSAAAILIGDLCLSWADEMLLSCGMDAPALLRGKPVYDVMRTELMAGQYLDILEQARSNDQVEPALQVARFKSAKYTIERPLFGAALAGGDPTVAALREYWLDLGIAFQLRDDLLGVCSDPVRPASPAATTCASKRTVLIALALQGRPSQADELAGWTPSTPEHVAHLRELVTQPTRHQVETWRAVRQRPAHRWRNRCSPPRP